MIHHTAWLWCCAAQCEPRERKADVCWTSRRRRHGRRISVHADGCSHPPIASYRNVRCSACRCRSLPLSMQRRRCHRSSRRRNVWQMLDASWLPAPMPKQVAAWSMRCVLRRHERRHRVGTEHGSQEAPRHGAWCRCASSGICAGADGVRPAAVCARRMRCAAAAASAEARVQAGNPQLHARMGGPESRSQLHRARCGASKHEGASRIVQLARNAAAAAARSSAMRRLRRGGARARGTHGTRFGCGRRLAPACLWAVGSSVAPEEPPSQLGAALQRPEAPDGDRRQVPCGDMASEQAP